MYMYFLIAENHNVPSLYLNKYLELYGTQTSHLLSDEESIPIEENALSKSPTSVVSSAPHIYCKTKPNKRLEHAILYM